ncbi:MAG: hypothetical protein AABW49_00505 [Nanoarchaeota archaeon]
MVIAFWITTIISFVLVLFAGHLLITLVLPRVKELMLPLTKDDKIINPLIAILLLIIVAYVLKAFTEIITTVDNNILQYILVISPAVNMFTEFIMLIQWIIVAIIIALGFKKKL